MTKSYIHLSRQTQYKIGATKKQPIRARLLFCKSAKFCFENHLMNPSPFVSANKLLNYTQD